MCEHTLNYWFKPQICSVGTEEPIDSCKLLAVGTCWGLSKELQVRKWPAPSILVLGDNPWPHPLCRDAGSSTGGLDSWHGVQSLMVSVGKGEVFAGDGRESSFTQACRKAQWTGWHLSFRQKAQGRGSAAFSAHFQPFGSQRLPFK